LELILWDSLKSDIEVRAQRAAETMVGYKIQGDGSARRKDKQQHTGKKLTRAITQRERCKKI
jgi:hypothetical protein